MKKVFYYFYIIVGLSFNACSSKQVIDSEHDVPKQYLPSHPIGTSEFFEELYTTMYGAMEDIQSNQILLDYLTGFIEDYPNTDFDDLSDIMMDDHQHILGALELSPLTPLFSIMDEICTDFFDTHLTDLDDDYGEIFSIWIDSIHTMPYVDSYIRSQIATSYEFIPYEIFWLSYECVMQNYIFMHTPAYRLFLLTGAGDLQAVNISPYMIDPNTPFSPTFTSIIIQVADIEDGLHYIPNDILTLLFVAPYDSLHFADITDMLYYYPPEGNASYTHPECDEAFMEGYMECTREYNTRTAEISRSSADNETKTAQMQLAMQAFMECMDELRLNYYICEAEHDEQN